MEPALSFIELCRAASYNRHWDRNAQQIRREVCDPKSSFHKKHTTFRDTADWNRIFEFQTSESKAGSKVHIGYDNGIENTDPYYHVFGSWPNYKEVPLRERQHSAGDPGKAKQNIGMFYSVTSKRFYSKLLLF